MARARPDVFITPEGYELVMELPGVSRIPKAG